MYKKNLKKLTGTFIFLFVFCSPVMMSAATSSISYRATQVYAGVRTSGTLPSTSKVTVSNVRDNKVNVLITPQQQKATGWRDAASPKNFGSETKSFTMSSSKPTKLFIKTASGNTANIHGTFKNN